MESKKSNHNFKLRLVKKYGDAAILLGFYTTDWWKTLITKPPLAFWQMFRGYIRFLTAIFANAIGALFRYKHGYQTTGLTLPFCTIVLLVLFNSNMVVFGLKPIMLPVAPFIYLFADMQDKWDWIIDDIHSVPMAVFTVLYTMISLIHTAMIYIGWGNPDTTKRGNSWLYEFVLKKSGLFTEAFTQAIIEPVLIVLIGWLFWALGDPVFAVFLWIGAACVFTQDGLDWAWQQKNSTSAYQ